MEVQKSLFDFMADPPEEPAAPKKTIVRGRIEVRAKAQAAITAKEPATKPEVLDTSWYAPLRKLESKGSQTKVVGGLAGLHEARREHEGQFFTPNAIAAFMWSLIKSDADRHYKLTVLDNSFGSGRLFQFADPEKHQLYGIEKDEELAEAVKGAVRSAGFDAQLMTGSMEDFRMPQRSLDVAFINPPFSIHLDNARVEPFQCNAFGKHGARSSTLTQNYAVAQALNWCRAVVAVVPRSFALSVKEDPVFGKRLHAVYHLPTGSFRSEGAEVDVSLLVWGEDGTEELIEEELKKLQASRLPDIQLQTRYRSESQLRHVEEGDGEAVVTLPVTGDRTVRIVHSGRKIQLKFACGAAQGRVMNTVLKEQVHGYRGRKERLPQGVKFTGQGQLDLECHLAQEDPVASLEKLSAEISACRCNVEIDPGVLNLLRKRARRLAVQQTPFRHVANVTDGGLSRWLAEQEEVVGIAQKPFPIWEHSYHDDRDVKKGAKIKLTRRERDGKWEFSHKNCGSSMTTEQLLDRMEIPAFQEQPNTWTVIHGGLAEAHPELFHQTEQRAKRLGLDQWCSWSYQFHDLVELGMKRGNAVIGWDMGIGKSQPLDSKILTPKGWTLMGDIHTGDEVIGSDGKPTVVLGVYPQGERPIYRVTFSDGSFTECDEEHLWTVYTPKARWGGYRPRTLSLRQIMDNGLKTKWNNNRKFFIPMVAPVEFSQTQLPVDPYLLGVLLGDGGLSRPRVSLTSADQEILVSVAKAMPAGMTIMPRKRYVYDLILRRGSSNPLLNQMRALKLSGHTALSKFIPKQYQLASIKDRVALLQGLLDTDGHVRADNNVEYCTISWRLAKDIQFIVRSLGGNARIRSKETTYPYKGVKHAGRTAYRMSIILPAGIQPFRLTRKRKVYRPRVKYPPTRAIAAIEPVGKKPAQCIRVSAANQLYVTDNFIVTHNTRLSLALCKLGEGKSNLIVVETHLVKEMIREIEVLGIPKAEWQVIEKPHHLNQLRKYNLIAYSRLKMAVDKEHPKVSYAKKLRRRIHTCIADEAHLLRNLKTDQSQAVFQLSPKVRYAMTGTPIANYPRDVLPLIQWAAGDGKAGQPYGLHHPYMEEKNVQDMTEAVRGVDVFKELFVTLEWVTNEFAEDLRTGAKREIPKIKDVDAFRALVAPVIKRRVMEEPEVAAHITIPKPIRHTRQIDWDTDHAVYYVKAAREFVDWFKNLSQYEKKNVGLIAILAKMHAVYTAANFPQAGVANLPPYGKMTSKQRYAIERLCQLTEEGHKTIFYAHSPAVVEYMSSQLNAQGVANVSFHGEITVANRIKALDDQFRFGTAPVLLATKGVLQTGYNIYQADRVLFYDRSWTPKIEQQSAARVLRPQQEKQVEIEYLHLDGSIDSYQAQMVEFKAEAMKAGLDFGDEDESRDFVHIETILGKFVEDFETKIGQKFDLLISPRKSA